MTIHLTKTLIRQACLTQRIGLSPQFIQTASQKITAKIQTIQAYQRAKYIATYLAVKGEVDLSGLLQDSKHWYLPIIQPDKTLIFSRYHANTALSPNRYGILEPTIDTMSQIAIENLDMIILPVVAFDLDFTRLGNGGGYYDRSLAQYPNLTRLAVAYDWQKQDFIPTDRWDIKPDIIVTEQEILLYSSKA